MITVKAILAYQVFIPVWAWLFFAALAVADQLVKKDKSNRAQSVLHLVTTYALKAGLGSMPFLGDILRMIDAQAPVAVAVAAEPEAPAPAVPASSSLRSLPMLLALGALSLMACAAPIALQRGITATAQIGQGAEDVVTAADVQHDADIAAIASQPEAAQAAVKGWRSHRAKARAGLRGFYTGLLAVEVAVATSIDAKGSKVDYVGLLGELTKIVQQLVKTLDEAGIKLPSYVKGVL